MNRSDTFTNIIIAIAPDFSENRTTPISRSLDGTVDLQGHRGARGKRPENSIPAFQYAIENHMTTIELDTHPTKDHQLIVYHDAVLNGKICRQKNGEPAAPIPVRELTVAELKRLDCGYGDNQAFPEQTQIKGTALITLTELFEFVIQFEHDHPRFSPVRFNIETKFGKDHSRSEVNRAARLMVDAIAGAGMIERSTVQSFVLTVLAEIKRLDGRLKTSALFQPGSVQALLLKSGISRGRETLIQKALGVRADIISPHFLYVNRKFVQRCHGCGKKVLPWVLNDEKMMEDFFDWGVDGIISDYPDRLYRVYSRWSTDRKLENQTAADA